MGRPVVQLVVACVFLHTALASRLAADEARLAAPRVFAQGADRQTTAAFELLLVQEMRRELQGRIVRDPNAKPCAEPECAAAQARRLGLDAALLCTLTRLGEEHVAVLQCVDAHGQIVWSHRLTAARPEDLSEVATRLGEAAASGRLPKPSSERAVFVDGRRAKPGMRRGGERRPDETRAPGAYGSAADGLRAGGGAGSAASRDGATPELEARRSLMSQGPRFGAVYPLAGSYAGVARMTTFAWVWRHQTPTFTVEAIPVLGLAWGGDLDGRGCEARDWSIMDLFVCWTPRPGDLAPIVGAGIGLHGVRLQRDDATAGRQRDSRLAVELAVGGGLTLFRTYDFQVALDARYHVALDRFAEVGGKGAHGFELTFGLQRR